jgi:hypothetical protein
MMKTPNLKRRTHFNEWVVEFLPRRAIMRPTIRGR